MNSSELSRPVKIKALASEAYKVEATVQERAALAKRFGLPAITSLFAELTLSPGDAAIEASGTLSAEWQQNCAVSGDEFPVSYREQLQFRFVPARGDAAPDAEIELAEADCDEIEFDGDTFDLGEAVAQSFGLVIDPYATGPNAERVRQEKGITVEGDAPSGPLAEALSVLKKD